MCVCVFIPCMFISKCCSIAFASLFKIFIYVENCNNGNYNFIKIISQSCIMLICLEIHINQLKFIGIQGIPIIIGIPNNSL